MSPGVHVVSSSQFGIVLSTSQDSHKLFVHVCFPISHAFPVEHSCVSPEVHEQSSSTLPSQLLSMLSLQVSALEGFE